MNPLHYTFHQIPFIDERHVELREKFDSSSNGIHQGLHGRSVIEWIQNRWKESFIIDWFNCKIELEVYVQKQENKIEKNIYERPDV